MALSRASRGLARLLSSRHSALYEATRNTPAELDFGVLSPHASCRFSTSPTASAASLKDKLAIVTLPQLSPNMSSGSIRKWLKSPGEKIAMYDVVMEVDTDNLTEEAYKVDDFEGTVTLLVEAQEDGYLGKILIEEGEEVKVHTPVATMCEAEENVEAVKGPEADELLKQPDQLRQLTWQSYLKESKHGRKGCS